MKLTDVPLLLPPSWTHRIAAWLGLTAALDAFPCCDDHPDPWGPTEEEEDR